MPLPKDEVYGHLTSSDGESIELDRDQYEELRSHLRVIEGGKTVASADDPLIGTGQAAEMLGVSRRTLTRMLDAGEIPCIRYGNGHRRMRTSDVIKYLAERKQRRHEGLERMRQHFDEAGMYDDLDLIEAYLAQFQ